MKEKIVKLLILIKNKFKRPNPFALNPNRIHVYSEEQGYGKKGNPIFDEKVLQTISEKIVLNTI